MYIIYTPVRLSRANQQIRRHFPWPPACLPAVHSLVCAVAIAFGVAFPFQLCIVFAQIVEFLGGYMAGSLAIMTDAAHLASDCISFVIGLVAIWLGGRPPDDRMTFGYKRMGKCDE